MASKVEISENISLVQKLDQKTTCTTKNKASFSLSNLESPRLTKNIKIYIPNVFLIQSFMGTFTVNPKQNDYLNNERDANNGKQVKINGEQHPASGKRGKWHLFQNGRSLQIWPNYTITTGEKNGNKLNILKPRSCTLNTGTIFRTQHSTVNPVRSKRKRLRRTWKARLPARHCDSHVVPFSLQ